MGKVVIDIQNLGKQYKLGTVGTGTLSHDLNRWWAKLRGKDDPFLKIGDVNDRENQDSSGYVWALQNISLQLEQGDVLGVIGRNGAGKSTLLKLLSKITSPSSGSIKINGSTASLLEVGTGFHPELTGRENVFLNGAILGMNKQEIRSKLDEIIDFSGCGSYIDTPVKRYSSGMMVRLGFSVAAHMEPEILVVDEVLAVGDIEFQNKCVGKMNEVSKSGRTVLFVSHNMQAVGKLCTKGLYLRNGQMVSMGDLDDVLEDYVTSTASNNFRYINENKIENAEGVIVQAEIINESGKGIGETGIGDVWGVRVKFRLNKSAKHVIVAAGMTGSLDENITTSWSTPRDLNAGEYEVTIWNDDILFSAGSYYFTLGLSTFERAMHYLEKEISFMIVETGREVLSERIARLKGTGFLLNQMREEFVQL
jgi:homopolymeric O-antigen transport system ATP-binding protein